MVVCLGLFNIQSYMGLGFRALGLQRLGFMV